MCNLWVGSLQVACILKWIMWLLRCKMNHSTGIVRTENVKCMNSSNWLYWAAICMVVERILWLKAFHFDAMQEYRHVVRFHWKLETIHFFPNAIENHLNQSNSMQFKHRNLIFIQFIKITAIWNFISYESDNIKCVEIYFCS